VGGWFGWVGVKYGRGKFNPETVFRGRDEKLGYYTYLHYTCRCIYNITRCNCTRSIPPYIRVRLRAAHIVYIYMHTYIHKAALYNRFRTNFTRGKCALYRTIRRFGCGAYTSRKLVRRERSEAGKSFVFDILRVYIYTYCCFYVIYIYIYVPRPVC